MWDMDLATLGQELAVELAAAYPGVTLRLEGKGDVEVERRADLRADLERALRQLVDAYPWGLVAYVTIDGRDRESVVVNAELSGQDITTDVDLRSSHVDVGPREILRVARRPLAL
jgi:hypothetical protein